MIQFDVVDPRSDRDVCEEAWQFVPVLRFDLTADDIAEHLSEEILLTLGKSWSISG